MFMQVLSALCIPIFEGQDHIFEGLLGGLPYAVSVRAHYLEANVAQNMSGSFCSYAA